MVEKSENDAVPLLRRTAPWLAALSLLGGGVTAAITIITLLHSEPAIFRTLLAQQARAIFGIPIAALSSFCVVWVLEATSGRIEFEVGGVKFRGASGPVVLWVMAFSAFVLAICVLWI